MTSFTVDTHLFRELGELLVGRESTALVELIKNAYDADATEVVVYGQALDDPVNGILQLRDTGIGMNRQEFERGFLRIASRMKDGDVRRSPLFERRYTGAKGVGRLAAHKLARYIEITSSRWDGAKPEDRLSAPLKAERTMIAALIDWDKVEECETLDQVPAANAITVKELPTGANTKPGTTVTLRRLRRAWTRAQHGRFLEEVQMFSAPEFLQTRLPESLLPQKLLFDEPIVRDVSVPFGQAFDVKLEGELAPPDGYWQPVLDAAQWIIEIDANKKSGKVRFGVAPTEATRLKLPDARTVLVSIDHPNPSQGPFFQARILVRPGAQPGDQAIRDRVTRAAGVRVFMEGFRVLPYGEPRNDWLFLDRDVASRVDRLTADSLDGVVSLLSDEVDDVSERPGLLVLPNKHYVGAVFLTQRRAPTLQTLVNREGFIPGQAYEHLASLVRTGLDLATRTRAAASYAERARKRQKRKERNEQAEKSGPTGQNGELERLTDSMRSAVAAVEAEIVSARTSVSAGNVNAAVDALSRATAQLSHAGKASSDLVYEQAMLRVLASIGTQFASFTHEINGLLGATEAIERFVEKLRANEEKQTVAQLQKSLGRVRQMVGDIRRNLERQASYLVDVVTPDARRRRSRQVLTDRFDSAVRLVQHAAERRDITIKNDLPADLKSPPMYPAELTTLFSNLLTNAVKFAGKGGRVRATARRFADGRSVIRIENTGERVDLDDAERWFQPFQSTTAEVDAVLGQGMGLGLTITRRMLDGYGAAIQFVRPSAGYSTALEITLPNS